MQKKNEFSEYSDLLDIDFFDWEDDFVSGNVQVSDIENDFGSKNLIRSLQFTNNTHRILSRNSLPLKCQEENSRHGNIAALTCKKVKVSKRNASYSHVPEKDNKKMDILSQNKITSNTRKNLDDENSDDSCSSNKKRKRRKILSIGDSAKYEEMPVQGVPKSQSDSMTISSQSSGGQIESISSQESSSCKMNTSSQKMPAFQNMIVLSQETSASQNTTSSQECTSPKRIASSQESLGNQVMNISIKDDSNVMSNATQSSSATRIVITPCQTNSNCQRIMTREENSSSKINILKKETIDSKYLTVSDQKSPDNKTVSIKNIRKLSISDSPEKNKIAENSVSEFFCNKKHKRYSQTEKKMIWSIRKRELMVTKRENAVDIREKLLDDREACILKREAILKAKERKYLRYKTNMTKWINQKLTYNSKKLRRKIGVLEAETNAFN